MGPPHVTRSHQLVNTHPRPPPSASTDRYEPYARLQTVRDARLARAVEQLGSFGFPPQSTTMATATTGSDEHGEGSESEGNDEELNGSEENEEDEEDEEDEENEDDEEEVRTFQALWVYMTLWSIF